jgi:ketosteroid isomerase-like protein
VGVREPAQLFAPGTFRIEPVSTIAAGNRVAVEWKGFATSARGGDYRQQYHMAFELTDAGRIATVREYNDTLHSHGVHFS